MMRQVAISGVMTEFDTVIQLRRSNNVYWVSHVDIPRASAGP